MPNSKLIVGTRGSALALWQARHVIEKLESLLPSLHVEVKQITTQGDRVRDRALSQVAVRNLATDVPPDQITLAAIDRTWQVEWLAVPENSVTVNPSGPFELQIRGDIDDGAAWRAALRSWLIERGREHLIPWTEEMSATLSVELERITIRCQRTRWGSHTTRPGRPGTVSLNAQLLFLPHSLARYVILHELCHAVHADHSAAFWALVQRHEAASDRLRAELRGAWRHVPQWVLRQPG
jgi:predicted metal-dependent hydrolase